jgi:hypothetical protein
VAGPERKSPKKPRVRPPFEFFLEELASLDPVIRPMFGAHAVYLGERIVVIVRSRTEHVDDNGIWIACHRENHPSLARDFPMMRSIRLLQLPGKPDAGQPTSWQNLPEKSDGFEEAALKLACLIRAGDQRIGKVPASRGRKKVKAAAKGRQ